MVASVNPAALPQKSRPWGCLLASFARALNVTDDQLMECIGHDGSTVLWPDVAEPGCRRGFHVQELIRVSRSLGFSVTPVEMFPSLRHPTKTDLFRTIYGESEAVEKFHQLIHQTWGVLVGNGTRWPHAVHYARGLITDPDVGQYAYSIINTMGHGFYPMTAYVCEAH